MIPFGPKRPIKKPQPKAIEIDVNSDIVLGWIDFDLEPVAGVEIYAFDGENYETPLDGVYTLVDYSYTIQVLNGVIQ